ncbi:MAG: hypothetical protein HYZ00_03325 [Candidatus Hydrogenedentes bacterium]|nr:hypothetical protein [Candidatus Hydrogenedentota bacterium]
MGGLGFFLNGMGPDLAGGQIHAVRQASQAQAETKSEVNELQRQVERLALLNQAMWEVLRDRLGLSDADLEAMAHAVDMRDGTADDRMTAQAVRCPSCSRVNNSRHAKCLYCGQLFEKPLFG